MHRCLTTLLALLSPLALFVASAQAQTVMLAGPGDFSGSESLITFDDQGLVNGGVVPEIDGVTFELIQLDVGAPAKYYVDTPPREFDPQGNGSVINFLGYSPPYPDLSVQFPDVMHRVAFAARTNPSDDVRVVLLLDGETVDEVVVPSRGSTQLYFYGFENEAGFDEVLVDAVDYSSGALILDNLTFESLREEPDPTAPMMLACDGFHSPWDRMLAKAKGRHLEFWKRVIERQPVRVLQARLLDAEGAAMSDAHLAAPPMVRVDLYSAGSDDPMNVTSAVLGRFPTTFTYDERGDTWRLVLPKRRMRALGTYVVSAQSGDEVEYAVGTTCTTSLEVTRGHRNRHNHHRRDHNHRHHDRD